MEHTVLKDVSTGKLIIVDDICEWADELQSGEYEYLWTTSTDTIQELTFQLTHHYIDEDSGRWQTQTLAFSKSIETLQAKAVEHKDIWDQQWQYNNGAFELTINDEEKYIIAPITLI